MTILHPIPSVFYLVKSWFSLYEYNWTYFFQSIHQICLKAILRDATTHATFYNKYFTVNKIYIVFCNYFQKRYKFFNFFTLDDVLVWKLTISVSFNKLHFPKTLEQTSSVKQVSNRPDHWLNSLTQVYPCIKQFHDAFEFTIMKIQNLHKM